ncbi:MAG: hypothetical protein JO069_02910 [Verrucomicrobia bacterium]|nr:hypothetical protein [Verrucomicrobiota bacterium]
MPRGGQRPGSGRPPGRRDTVPRGGKKYERLKSAAADFDTTEFIFTNENKTFQGTALQFMKLVYQSEHMPVRVRVFAAQQAARYETEAGSATLSEDGLPIGANVHIFLPHNFRDDAKAIEVGHFTAEELENYEREHAAQVERFDRKLRQWVTSGQLSEASARLVRMLWVKHSDPPWEPVQPPAPPPRALPWHRPSPSPPDVLNGHEAEIEVPATVVLFSSPGALYQINFKTYRANRLGEIEADANDADALRQAGCRVQR